MEEVRRLHAASQPARRRMHAGRRRARPGCRRARAPRRGRAVAPRRASRPRTPTTCARRSCWRCSARRRRSSPLPLELVCARAAVIARNKAIDHGRRRARAPLVARRRAAGARADAGARAGSLADGLDEVAALAHRRRVRADLVLALDRLDAPQRAAIGAHAEGGAARAAGLPRSTYYRVLAHAQARLSGDLRGRLAGARRARRRRAARCARDLPARRGRARRCRRRHGGRRGHRRGRAEPARRAAHAAAPAGRRARRSRGRAARRGAAPAPPRARAPLRRAHRRCAAHDPRARARHSRRVPRAARPPRAPCTYDPSSYDC